MTECLNCKSDKVVPWNMATAGSCSKTTIGKRVHGHHEQKYLCLKCGFLMRSSAKGMVGMVRK